MWSASRCVHEVRHIVTVRLAGDATGHRPRRVVAKRLRSGLGNAPKERRQRRGQNASLIQGDVRSLD